MSNGLAVTQLYAALIALGYVALSVRTLRTRRRLRVAIGDGDEAVLARAVRAHGNFAEYVPIALILMLLLELTGAGATWLLALGVTLLVGRTSHAFGVSQVNEDFRFRVFGMALTFTVIVGAALAIAAGYVI